MKMLIGGKWVDKEQTIAVHNPFDGSVVDTVPAGTTEDVKQAITIAHSSFKNYKNWPAIERTRVLARVAELLESRVEPLAKQLAQEGSKTLAEARKEVGRAANTIRLSAEEASRIHGETLPFDSVEGSNKRFGYYIREPIGVIAAITPYNDPLNLVCHKVGPAIAAGNAIVVKPTLQTPLSALALAELFVEAGLPEGLLSVVTGRAEQVGEPLVTDERIRMVSFTGGVSTGEKISKMAGIKKTSMELGSNSPVIVMDDCQFDAAVAATVSGAFSAVGQNCIGVQRIYVQQSIYEAFKQALIATTKEQKIGSQLASDTDIGPMINEQEAQRVVDWVQQAAEQGATILTGGQRHGTLVQPTLLENVPDHAMIAKEEIFGPAAIIYPFTSLGEAVAQANDVDYGLHAAIFTNNLEHAHYAIDNLDSGSVMINDSTDYRADMMPFGGRKKSGIGSEGVRFAVEEMTTPKVVCFNF